MKILIGVTDKMKLYNVYRLCKRNLNFFENLKAEQANDVYIIKNWLKVKETVDNISKIPALNKYACDFIETIPDTVRHKDNLLDSELRETQTADYFSARSR